MEQNDNWKTKTLIIGTIIGAVAGALASYLLVKRAEGSGEQVKVNPGEGVQLGLGILGLLRLLSK